MGAKPGRMNGCLHVRIPSPQTDPNGHTQTSTQSHIHRHNRGHNDRDRRARMHSWRRTPPTCRGNHVEVGKFALVAGLTEEVSVMVGQGHRLERLVALGTLEARLVPLPTSSEDLFVHVDRLVTASAFGSTTVAHSSSLLCTSFTPQDNADRVFSPRTRFVLREGKLPCPTKSLKKFVHWPAPLYRSPDPLPASILSMTSLGGRKGVW